MDRNAKFKLTDKDVAAIKSATLDSGQGVVRSDGSL